MTMVEEQKKRGAETKSNGRIVIRLLQTSGQLRTSTIDGRCLSINLLVGKELMRELSLLANEVRGSVS